MPFNFLAAWRAPKWFPKFSRQVLKPDASSPKLGTATAPHYHSSGAASTKAASKDDEQPLVVIFLDIDGVLKPDYYLNPDRKRGDPEFPDQCCEALARILQHVPMAQVVLSSCWRFSTEESSRVIRNLHDFCDRNKNDDIAIGIDRLRKLQKFYDVTPIYERRWDVNVTRQEEIYQWLENNKELGIAAWVALDDEELVRFGENRPHARTFANHVVKTDLYRGLNMEDAQLAIRLLDAQLQRRGRSL